MPDSRLRRGGGRDRKRPFVRITFAAASARGIRSALIYVLANPEHSSAAFDGIRDRLGAEDALVKLTSIVGHNLLPGADPDVLEVVLADAAGALREWQASKTVQDAEAAS